MKTRTTPLLILVVSLGFAGAGAARAASSPAAPAGAVILRDAAGKEIGRARSVWLAPGRLGVPAGAFLKLGLSGRVRPGKAELAYPFSDGATRFQAGERRVLRLSSDERRWSEEYGFPVARTQSGQLYVAAAVALKDFAGLVTGTPGPKRGTLILQRTDQLQSAVEQAEGGRQPRLPAPPNDPVEAHDAPLGEPALDGALPPAVDLHHRYASAARYFEPGLSEQEAGALAAAVLWEARQTGLDARFLLAVLAEEGSLARVRGSAAGVRIGSRPVGDAVAGAAKALAGHLAAARRAAAPSSSDPASSLAQIIIQEALLLRAAERTRTGRRSPAAQQFANRVLARYQALCGAD